MSLLRLAAICILFRHVKQLDMWDVRSLPHIPHFPSLSHVRRSSVDTMGYIIPLDYKNLCTKTYNVRHQSKVMVQEVVWKARQVNQKKWLFKEKNDSVTLGTSEATAAKVLDIVLVDDDGYFSPDVVDISVGANNTAHWRVWVHDEAKARDNDIHWAHYNKTVIDTEAGIGQAIDIHHMTRPRIRVMGWGDVAEVEGWARVTWRHGN